jgi:hypothetical protein
MKKIKLILLLLAIISIGSCQKNKEDKTYKEANAINPVSEKHVETVAKVSLNKGQLWKANPETTLGINALQKIILESGEEESASILKDKLNSEFALIFKKCTMKGEAHNQLHNYLIPLKLKIDNLEDSNKAEIKKEIITYLDEYPLFFYKA